MAYVAARGGEAAIQCAEALYRSLNGAFGAELVRAIERHMPYLVDRVMGDNRAAYAVLDTADRAVTLHRVAYDVDTAVQAITASGCRRPLRLSFAWRGDASRRMRLHETP